MKVKGTESSQRGAAMVEAALTMLVFLVFLFAVWDGGRLLQVQQTLNNAAREGARLAVAPLTQTSNLPTRGAVKDRVNRFLQAAGISGATISINGSSGGSDSDQIGTDDLPAEVIDTGRVDNSRFTRVVVTVPYNVLTISMFSFLEVDLTGRALMRNETSD